MNTNDMYQSIEDEVCRHLDLFAKWFKDRTFCDITSRPEVIFAPLTIDAGQCMYTWVEMNMVIGNIVFNTHMIPLNFEQYIKCVVPHEVSHWCHAVFHGYINDEEQNLEHGTQWQQLMKFFEADACSRIYGMASPPVVGLTQYGCDCCVVNLDDFDLINYAEDLYCPNCKKSYQPLTKEEA